MTEFTRSFVTYGGQPDDWSVLYKNFCGDNSFQQSPIILPEPHTRDVIRVASVLRPAPDVFVYCNNIPVLADAIRGDDDVVEYTTEVTVTTYTGNVGGGSLVLDGIVYTLISIRLLLGGAAHPIQGSEAADASLHVTFFNERLSETVIVEVHLIWDELNGVLTSFFCQDNCHVLSYSDPIAPAVWRAVRTSDDFNICALRDDEYSVDGSCNSTHGAQWQDAFGIEDTSLHGYLTYHGASMSPPCDGSVRYFVRPNPVRIQSFLRCDTLFEAINHSNGTNGMVREPQRRKRKTEVYLVRDTSSSAAELAGAAIFSLLWSLFF